MGDSKEASSSKYNRADALMNSETVTAHKTCTGSDQMNPSTEKRKWNKVPALTRKPFAGDTCRERENPFSPMEGHWGYHWIEFQGRFHDQA